MPAYEKCHDHCILWVRAHDRQLLLDALLPRRSRRMEITDHQSEEGRAAMQRRRLVGLNAAEPDYRYFGIISSLNHVHGADVSEHVMWVLSNFKPGFNLAQWAASGAQYGLSHGWWSGMGTDYGPVISPEVGALLMRHGVGLQISLYG